ncbi:MAG: hypothetical protein EU539_01785 [Promethearchaeota archaeon]|nr:MAG: hypothetical protein EU539_01785 [Candidatus Lokiarchaeota archaeon]
MSDEEKKEKTPLIYLFFFGLVIFITIFFPIFGSTLRYDFSILFSKMYHTIGIILTYMGFIFILAGILSLVCKRPLIGIITMIGGVMLLTFAGYFLNPATAGSGASGKEVPQGYY